SPNLVGGFFVGPLKDQETVGWGRAHIAVRLVVTAGDELAAVGLDGVAHLVDAALFITGLVLDVDLGHIVVGCGALRVQDAGSDANPAGQASAEHQTADRGRCDFDVCFHFPLPPSIAHAKAGACAARSIRTYFVGSDGSALHAVWHLVCRKEIPRAAYASNCKPAGAINQPIVGNYAEAWTRSEQPIAETRRPTACRSRACDLTC